MTARHIRPPALARRLAAVVATATALALASAGVVTSQASWTDREYVKGTAAALDCSASSIGSSTATGAELDGTLAGTDLGTIAQLTPMTVANNGTTATPTPTSATVAGTDAWTNPLTVSAAFGAVTVASKPFIVSLSTPVGVVNQYSRASSNASSAAAAGYVTNSGAVAADAATTPSMLGEIDLGTTLSAAFGSSLSTLLTNGDATSMKLDVGAVASAASVSGCPAAWARSIYPQLSRSYAIAALKLLMQSQLVGQLNTQVTNATGTVLPGISTSTTVLSGIVTGTVSGLTTLLGPLITGLGLGTPTVALTVAVNAAPVTAVLSQSFSDTNRLVTINPAAGTISVDLAALLGPVGGTTGLNGLAPNSPLLLDSAASSRLSAAVNGAVAALVAQIQSTLTAALNAATVTVTVNVPATVAGISVGTLQVKATNVTVGALAAGTAPITIGMVGCSGIIAGALCTTVTGVLSGLSPGLISSTLGPVVATAVKGTIVSDLASALTATGTSLATATVAELGALLGSTGILSILVNAQNAPDPASGGSAGPAAWAGFPAFSPGPPFSTGRFDVAALRISALSQPGRPVVSAVAFDLARSSVGANRIPAS